MPELIPMKGYRADVQALRGIAVLAVVLYHTGILLPGGYVGVDVFFVVSGFVIGRLLLRDMFATNSTSFRTFYSRRARRLLPALGLMLAVVVVLAPLLAPLGAQAVTTRTAIAASIFSANAYLYYVTDVGYFGAASELNPLLHTWSLSVEEQFYFLVPGMLLLAWRLGAKKARSLGSVRAFVIVALTVSFAACVFASYTDTIGPLDELRFAFFSPVTRAWQFVVGLGLVVLPARWFRSAVFRRWVLAFGFVLLGVAMVWFNDELRFPGVAALVPTIGTAMVIFGGTSLTGLDHGPAPKVLVEIGNISYSWYLWHWPLIVFAGALWPAAGSLPLVCAALLSLGPATLSYVYLEQKFRVAQLQGWRTVALAIGCMAVPILAVALSVPVRAAIEARPEVGEVANARQLHADSTSGCDNSTPLGERPSDKCVWTSGHGDKSVVLTGDSNAGHFSEALIGAALRNEVQLRIATMSACRFVEISERGGDEASQCDEFVRRSVDALESDPPDLVVIANSSDDIGAIDRAEYETGLIRVVDRLTAAGIGVAIINVVPKPEIWDPGQCSSLAVLANPEGCSFASFPVDESRATLDANRMEQRAADLGGAVLWDFSSLICPSGLCVAQRDGFYVWRDASHISVNTSEQLVSAMSEELGRSVGN